MSNGVTKRWVVVTAVIVGIIVLIIDQVMMSHIRSRHWELWRSYAHYYYCDGTVHPNATKCAEIPNHIPPPDPPPAK
jgi:hypothetical protein